MEDIFITLLIVLVALLIMYELAQVIANIIAPNYNEYKKNTFKYPYVKLKLKDIIKKDFNMIPFFNNATLQAITSHDVPVLLNKFTYTLFVLRIKRNRMKENKLEQQKILDSEKQLLKSNEITQEEFKKKINEWKIKNEI